ncbi:hypothetical protein TNIN_422291 [Trichonephila inaurata madagascariensis]|uniref:Uncharacterized protein n=1 Tax=Trichonephila inaurata madagascariensis TaxID=2747483 RepID=A0A8X6XRR6_9ARAC|nr:hypothetical protein TNIN_422291 [Trichonephila inaurata madagascariensis]
MPILFRRRRPAALSARRISMEGKSKRKEPHKQEQRERKSNCVGQGFRTMSDMANPGKWISLALLREGASIFNDCPTPFFGQIQARYESPLPKPSQNIPTGS